MKVTLIVLVFLGASFIAPVLWSEVLFSPSLELAFFDVGQGDAIFFETPQGHQVLIDGGPDAKVLLRLGEVMPFWDKTIDLVVLTHPDADHVAGLVNVLLSYEVKNVLWTGKRKDTKVFKAFEKALKKEGTQEILAKAGQRIVFEGSEAVLEILYPEQGIDIQKEKSNETSIIARLVYGEHEVLLLGDTTKKIEKRVVKAESELVADILKIAHHGSKTSTARELLGAVGPSTAIISVGKDNRFGHPHPEVLANLAEYGIKVRRTDQEGTILFYFPLPKFHSGGDN
ncbi:MBL fold metallo-hydrolase [Patescibacteria group bacterium]|nr:MBL fold metallo-hydrolase [Patescibacteria group bacterium]